MSHKVLSFFLSAFSGLFTPFQTTHKNTLFEKQIAFCLKTSNNSQLDYQKHIPSELNLYKYAYSHGFKKKKK